MTEAIIINDGGKAEFVLNRLGKMTATAATHAR